MKYLVILMLLCFCLWSLCSKILITSIISHHVHISLSLHKQWWWWCKTPWSLWIGYIDDIWCSQHSFEIAPTSGTESIFRAIHFEHVISNCIVCDGGAHQISTSLLHSIPYLPIVASKNNLWWAWVCLLYTSPSPRD